MEISGNDSAYGTKLIHHGKNYLGRSLCKQRHSDRYLYINGYRQCKHLYKQYSSNDLSKHKTTEGIDLVVATGINLCGLQCELNQ